MPAHKQFQVAETPHFGRVHFGFASAEEEGTNDPILLLKGFYDPDGLTSEVLDGHKYLVLGYKGSGKSAIGERLRLLAQQDNHLFSSVTLISDLPFSQFGRIFKSSEPTDAEVHYPIVWTWLLLVKLLESFSSDLGGKHDLEFSKTISGLREMGLLPATSFKQLVIKSTKTTFKAALLKFLEFSHESASEENDANFVEYVDHVKAVAGAFRSDSRHVLVIDGLDEILTLKNLQYQVLSALVLAVSRMNIFLRQSGAPAKILLLCRTDLFARLPGPNKNKIRRDAAIELDWYQDPREPSESHVVKLANLRAHLSNERIDDIFKVFFPLRVGNRSAQLFLTEHTRHTPRDFLQLLSSIQKYSGSGALSTETIYKGIRDYSTNYFLPEIRDELDGYASPAQIDSMFALLGALRRKQFFLSHLKGIAARIPRGADLDLPRMLELLFDCSAIGNVDPKSGHFWFKFRNRQSTINLDEALVLHFGLWKALNLE